MFLNVMAEDDSMGFVIVLGTASATHHLVNIRDGKVYILLCFAIKELSAFDNHQMGRGIHAPGQRARGHQDL